MRRSNYAGSRFLGVRWDPDLANHISSCTDSRATGFRPCRPVARTSFVSFDQLRPVLVRGLPLLGLDLHPAAARARPKGCIRPLANDALEAEHASPPIDSQPRSGLLPVTGASSTLSWPGPSMGLARSLVDLLGTIEHLEACRPLPRPTEHRQRPAPWASSACR